MNYNRIRYKNREEWLKGRSGLFGASELASIMEASPWVSKTQLWEEKTGRRKPKDLSNNEAVQRGVLYEPIIRNRFIKDNPDMVVSYYPYDILTHKDLPYLSATLDGELLYMGEDLPCGLRTGMSGVLEIKTGSYISKKYLDEWRGDYPPHHYFYQIAQQMLITGADFVWVQAKLFRSDKTWGKPNFYLPETYETSYLLFKDEFEPYFTPIIESVKQFKMHVDQDTIPWSTISLGSDL